MTGDGIGVPLRRREDRRFLTGCGRYVHDIVRPRQLHAVFLRSPHAHAEIVTINKAEALASPGFIAVFTAEDVTADKLNGVPCAWGIVGKDGQPMKEPRSGEALLSQRRWVVVEVAPLTGQSRPVWSEILRRPIPRRGVGAHHRHKRLPSSPAAPDSVV